MPDEKEFQEWVSKQEAKGKHPLENLQRQKDKEEFIAQYEVEDKPTKGIVCPFCTRGFTIGKLHKKLNYEDVYVCRTCRKTIRIIIEDES